MARFIGLAILVSTASIAVAQVEAHTNRLSKKTDWEVFTLDGSQTIVGKFDGFANDEVYIKDAEGFRHRIPVDAMADRDLFWEIRNPMGARISMPGNQARLAANPEYTQYRAKLRGRRTEALYERRQTYLSKPPARGWTGIAVPFNPLFPTYGRSMIEMGIVRQPPLYVPRRRYYRSVSFFQN